MTLIFYLRIFQVNCYKACLQALFVNMILVLLNEGITAPETYVQGVGQFSQEAVRMRNSPTLAEG